MIILFFHSCAQFGCIIYRTPIVPNRNGVAFQFRSRTTHISHTDTHEGGRSTIFLHLRVENITSSLESLLFHSNPLHMCTPFSSEFREMQRKKRTPFQKFINSRHVSSGKLRTMCSHAIFVVASPCLAHESRNKNNTSVGLSYSCARCTRLGEASHQSQPDASTKKTASNVSPAHKSATYYTQSLACVCVCVKIKNVEIL